MDSIESFAKAYYKLLNNDFKSINLTRITDFEGFYNKQIIDSIIPLVESDIFLNSINMNQQIVDVGFGGGFPLLPLAFKLKEHKILGIESKRKKIDVVSEISKLLDLNNLKFLHSRIENVLFDIECTCTFKAVGRVDLMLSKINTTKPINIFFYKGPSFYSDEGESLNNIKENWEIIESRELNVPGTLKRLLVGFRPKNVPCGTSRNNNLVKLSSIKY